MSGQAAKKGLGRHEVDPAELDALHAQDPLADLVDLVDPAPQHDHLQADVVAQVRVQRGDHQVGVLVL